MLAVALVWGSEDNAQGGSSSSPSTWLKQGLLAADAVLYTPGEQFSCLYLPSDHRSPWMTDAWHHMWLWGFSLFFFFFNVGTGDQTWVM